MTSARRWPPARVVSALRSECGLPDGGDIERAGPITRLAYRDNGLARCLEVYPKQFSAGLLQWRVSVGDDEIRSPTPALWTRYIPAPDLPEERTPRPGLTGYRWPAGGTALDEQLVRDVARFAAPMLWFLTDRRDLGRMLISHSDSGDGRIRRGEVIGSRWGERAAGIAAAVILARVIGDPDLEAAALAPVSSGAVSGRRVGRWAEQSRSWSPADISDLEQLGRQPSEVTRQEFAKYFPPG